MKSSIVSPLQILQDYIKVRRQENTEISLGQSKVFEDPFRYRIKESDFAWRIHLYNRIGVELREWGEMNCAFFGCFNFGYIGIGDDHAFDAVVRSSVRQSGPDIPVAVYHHLFL